MLKSLQIKNFQSHAESFLVFSPKVNVITGLSQSGKTAIIRALNWVTTNRPLGGNYFSNFAGKKGETKVLVSFEDLPDISLKKQVRINKKGEKEAGNTSYEMGEDSFQGMGRDVPDVVREAFNLSEINIQKQLDQPYLITSAPGEAGKVINKITKLEEVDEWVSKITTKINSANKESNILEGQLKDKKEQLEEYKDLPDMKAKVEVLGELYLDWEKENAACLQLEDITEKFMAIDNQIVETERILEVEKRVIGIEGLLLQCTQVAAEAIVLDSLVGISERVRNTQEFLESVLMVDSLMELSETYSDRKEQEKRLVEYTTKLSSNIIGIGGIENFLLAKDLILILDGSLIEVEDKYVQERHLASIVGAIEEACGMIAKREEVYLLLRRKYGQVLENLKLCPYCLGIIDKKTVKKIMEMM